MYAYVVFFHAEISRVKVRSLCNLGYERWPQVPGYPSVKTTIPHDPMFISFDALPACDRQTDIQTRRVQ